MSVGQAVALGIALVAVLSTAAIFTLAYRRETESTRVGTLDTAARRRRRRPAPVMASGAPVVETETARPAEEASVPAPKRELVELSPAEFGAARRQFLNRATGASFGAFLAFFGITSLAFLWPRLKGGFGAKVDAGDIAEIKAAIFQPDGSIAPFYVAEAKTYVVPFDESLISETDFDGIGVVVEGLTGLFQKCVHLGCRVPWCASSQGFECPCHGSKYNAAGEYEAGPAPRNLDRFAIEAVEGRLIINTGSVRDTPRAKRKTVAYPQGVNCR